MKKNKDLCAAGIAAIIFIVTAVVFVILMKSNFCNTMAPGAKLWMCIGTTVVIDVLLVFLCIVVAPYIKQIRFLRKKSIT